MKKGHNLVLRHPKSWPGANREIRVKLVARDASLPIPGLCHLARKKPGSWQFGSVFTRKISPGIKNRKTLPQNKTKPASKMQTPPRNTQVPENPPRIKQELKTIPRRWFICGPTSVKKDMTDWIRCPVSPPLTLGERKARQLEYARFRAKRRYDKIQRKIREMRQSWGEQLVEGMERFPLSKDRDTMYAMTGGSFGATVVIRGADGNKYAINWRKKLRRSPRIARSYLRAIAFGDALPPSHRYQKPEIYKLY